MKHKVTLAVTTYNRKKTVEAFSRVLYKSIDRSFGLNIRVYDDKSQEYDFDDLKFIFPYATEITRNKENFKADKNMYELYKRFLLTEDEYLIQLDSDMLIGKNFFKYIYEIINEIKKEESVYSLYNSSNHPVKKQGKSKKILEEIFNEKEHIGGACVVFSRKTINRIMKELRIENDDFSNLDWRWSKYLFEYNIPIYVSENSYVQHIGIGGQNNTSIKNLDIGKSFVGIEDINGANFIIQYYQKLIQQQEELLVNLTFKEYLKIKIKKNKYFMKIIKYFKKSDRIL